MAKLAIETVIKAVDQVTAPMRRITRNVSRAARVMGRAFAGVTKSAGKLAKSIASVGGTMSKFGAAAGVGLATGLVLLNKSTVEATQLAKATGQSVENIEAFTAAIKPAGFSLDNINDLAEEMNNKFGEIATAGAPKGLQEGLKALSLNARELNKLEPDARFRKIADAILRTKNQTEALSAADKIFGGEANKVFGVLRAQAGTTEELIRNYRELNFLTDEGRSGAASFTNAFNKLVVMVGSLTREFAGLLGEALTPLIQSMSAYISQNKELIKLKIGEFIQKITAGVKAFMKFFKDPATQKRFGEFVDNIKSLVPSINSLVSALRVMGTVARAAFEPFRIVGTALGEGAAATVMGAERLAGSISRTVTANPMAFAAAPSMGMGFGPVMPMGRSPAAPSQSINGEIVVKAAPGTEIKSAKGSDIIKAEQTGGF